MLLHFLLFPRSGHHLYLNPRGCSNPRFNSFCMSYIIQHTPPHGGPQIFSFWIKTMATLVWIYFTWSIQFKQRNSKTITFLYIVENMHPGYAFRARKCSMHKTHGRHEKLRNVNTSLLCIPRETKGRTSPARFLRCTKHTSTFYERDVTSCSRRRSPCILPRGRF